MLDFNAPNGYRVRCWSNGSIYVVHPCDSRTVAVYTPEHGDTIYPDLYPTMVEGREALKYGKQYFRDQNQVEQE